MINITRAVTAARLHLDNGMVVSEADAKLICEALRATNDALGRLREVSARMAEDDGLWFMAESAAEAYVQQELRKLCVLIESPVSSASAIARAALAAIPDGREAALETGATALIAIDDL